MEEKSDKNGDVDNQSAMKKAVRDAPVVNAPRCLGCHSTQLRFRKKDNKFVCQRCGEESDAEMIKKEAEREK